MGPVVLGAALALMLLDWLIASRGGYASLRRNSTPTPTS
jgi:hypothetical protein